MNHPSYLLDMLPFDGQKSEVGKVSGRKGGNIMEGEANRVDSVVEVEEPHLGRGLKKLDQLQARRAVRWRNEGEFCEVRPSHGEWEISALSQHFGEAWKVRAGLGDESMRDSHLVAWKGDRGSTCEGSTPAEGL